MYYSFPCMQMVLLPYLANSIAEDPLTHPSAVGALAFLGMNNLLGLSYNKFQLHNNEKKTSGEVKAAYLRSSASPSAYSDLLFGTEGTVARFFTPRNVRLEIVDGATSGDFKSILEDSSYQHVVLQGHGSRDMWMASDANVFTQDVDVWMENAPKKSGYFVHLGCGTTYGRPLGASVVESPEKLRGYLQKSRGFDMIELFIRGLASLPILEGEGDGPNASMGGRTAGEMYWRVK